MSESRDPRAAELAANLDRVRARIAAAESAAGRPAGCVELVVVTKFFPAADVRRLVALGVSNVGENRHQEAEAKAAECADLDVRWHYIGGLQSNKAAAVAAYADVVQAVDRAKLVAPLARGAARAGRAPDVLIQVSLDPPAAHAGRSGAAEEEVVALADLVASTAPLTLRGLMAVAPLGQDPRVAFDRLWGIQQQLLASHPDARWLSAGMSEDLEAAIDRGATHVRVGRAILGTRPTVQ